MSETNSTLHPAYFLVRFRIEEREPRWPERFAIITAYATTCESWSEARNFEADARLHAELVERGLHPIRITGYDPATGHAEPGWTVELPLDNALELGRRYVQDAIFWVEGGQVFVVSCGPKQERGLVGAFRTQGLDHA